ncbi:hypothetical protein D3C81_2090060 [compost metagenome]
MAGALHQRQRGGVDRGQPGQRGGRQFIRADVADHGRQVAHAAITIHDARALCTGLSYAY